MPLPAPWRRLRARSSSGTPGAGGEPSIYRRITRNAGALMLAEGLNRGLQFLAVPVIAALLGVEQLGLYTLIGTIQLFFAVLTNLGIGAVTVREIAASRESAGRLFPEILGLRLAISIVAYLPLAAFLTLARYSPDTKQLVYLSSLSFLPYAVSGSYETAAKGFERMHVVALVNAANAVARTGLGVALIVAGFGLGAFIACAVAVDYATAVAWAVVGTRWGFTLRPSIAPATWRAVLADSLPFAAVGAATTLNRSASIFLLSLVPGPIDGKLAIGYFAPGSSIARLPQPFLLSLRQAILPSIFASRERGAAIESGIPWSLRLVFWSVSMPLLIAGLYFPDLVIHLLFSKEQYAESVPIFSVLAVAFALHCMTLGLSAFLAASRDVRHFFYHSLIALAVNLVVGGLLIPRWTAFGAAVGVLGSTIYEFGAAVAVSRRVHGANSLRLADHLSTMFEFGGLALVLLVLKLGIRSAPVAASLSVPICAAFAVASLWRFLAARPAKGVA